MKNQTFYDWCREATEKIRYGPDREVVSKELRDHLEDKYDALIAKGLSPEEAEAQSIRAMGSAQEIAPQLAAIHRPWLGYLYSIARFFGISTAIMAMALLVVFTWDRFFTKISCDNYESFAEYAEDFYKPDVSISVEGYGIRSPEAAVDRDADQLHFQVEVTYWPWMEEFGALNEFWALDSEGNTYPSINEFDYMIQRGLVYRSSMASGGISVSTITLAGFDCDAQWVELHYDRDGRDIVLRIDLTGGGKQ